MSFKIRRGDIAAVIGPNGSGKTSLLRAILGLAHPESGTIHLLGGALHDVRGQIGYVPQRFQFDRLFPITVREFLLLNAHGKCPESHLKETVGEVGLSGAVLPKRLGSLSGGQLQRVLIAQAILHRPPLLFLDEPSAGIDIGGEDALYDVLKHLNNEHSTTILMVSHDIAMLSSLVQTVVCVNHTLISAGPPKRVLTEKTLGELFGARSSLYLHEHSHPV